MAEPPGNGPSSMNQRMDLDELLGWMSNQRWFAAKSQTLTGAEIIEEAQVSDGLVLAVVQVRFATGGHELYQIPFARGPSEPPADVLTEPVNARPLLEAIDRSRELEGIHGRFSFRHVGEGRQADPTIAAGPVRAMGAEQSNSSLVFAERLVLKLFRKLE